MGSSNPVLVALAQARLRTAPLFARWCELNGACFCPARPADVTRFVSDCASLGIEQLWPAVQEISRLHASRGLADPTLGSDVTAAINTAAGIQPPRSWPAEQKLRFASLPYDMQVFVASHDARREKALRRAQNEAAAARRELAKNDPPQSRIAEENKADETNQQRKP
ncbi:hypothetical protein ES703_06669 [subsurface metagenome]|jgi:hypothetical protein